MAVYGLFKNKAFEPETIVAMTRAHAEVCRAIGLGSRDRPAADAIAKKVIEFAQRGERDPVRLRENVLQALQAEPELAGHCVTPVST
jgi:hypothetical protein